MNFEKLYSKLPNMIKFNNTFLKFFLAIAKKIRNFNKKSQISNSQNQLFELILLNSNFKVKGILRDTQLFNLELLRFIDNVCNKHKIDYWITGGTLLGAVRHGGFIPWDDDVDINFMREDYERFIQVIPNEIKKYEYFKENCGLTLLRDNKNYFSDFHDVYDFEGDESLLKNDKFMFLQLAWMKPYIKIDFFPEDYVSEDKLDYFNKKYLITKYRFNEEIKSGKKSFDKEFDKKCKQIGFVKNKTSFFNDSLDTLNLFPISIRKTDEVFPLSNIEFEGYSFKCPKNNDYYLKKLFGTNYMKLPDVIETHNISDFVQTQFKSKEEMNNKFKKDLEYLRKINDEF